MSIRFPKITIEEGKVLRDLGEGLASVISTIEVMIAQAGKRELDDSMFFGQVCAGLMAACMRHPEWAQAVLVQSGMQAIIEHEDELIGDDAGNLVPLWDAWPRMVPVRVDIEVHDEFEFHIHHPGRDPEDVATQEAPNG